jgi:hypothetical protein
LNLVERSAGRNVNLMTPKEISTLARRFSVLSDERVHSEAATPGVAQKGARGIREAASEVTVKHEFISSRISQN